MVFVIRCIIYSRYYLFQVISILGNIWILDGWICYPLYNLFQVSPPGLLISVKVLLGQEKGYWRGSIHKILYLHTQLGYKSSSLQLDRILKACEEKENNAGSTDR